MQSNGERDLIRCSQCGRGFNRQAGDRCIASVSGSIMGDEYTEAYYFCCQCQGYTVKIYLTGSWERTKSRNGVRCQSQRGMQWSN